MRVVPEAGLSAERSKRFIRGAVVLLCCGALLGPNHPVVAGEKIQISGTNSSGQVNLPKGAEPQGVIPSSLSNRRISSGESGQGPVLPPPNLPVYVRDPKIEELIDRKQNWIYDSPNRLGRDQAIEDIFGVRKYELDNLDKKPKRVVEQFMESSKDSRSNSNDNRAAHDSAGRDTLRGRTGLEQPGRVLGRDDSRSRDSGSRDSGIIPELNPAPLFNWNTSPEGLSQIGTTFGGSSFLATSSGQPLVGNRTPEPVKQDNPVPRGFDQTWNSSQGVMNRMNDPINESADATRAIMNPIAARKASAPPPGLAAQGRSGQTSYAFGSPAAPMSTRPDLFIPTRDKSSGPGLGSPPPAPVSSPVSQPKPMVLEIPRPTF